MEQYQDLVNLTRQRVSNAMRSLLDGAGPDEAVLGSGMLKLFDDGDHIDGMAQLEELASTDPSLWEQARVQAVFDALGQMLATCSRWHPSQGGERLTAELVHQYHGLAALVPLAVWRFRLEAALERLTERSSDTVVLVEAKSRAVERLGSVTRLMSAVEEWQPDSEERSRLQRLMAEGREVEAVVQALEQAVFAAELDEL
jgi:hypothetical protein